MEWFEALEGITELESTEGFLDYFGLAYDPVRIRASRLHIMHHFHQALLQATDVPLSSTGRYALAARLLAESVAAFASVPVRDHSTLRVYRRLDPLFIPLESLTEVA